MAPPRQGNVRSHGDSTWVSRTYFSRSICYRIGSNSFSNIQWPLFEGDTSSKQSADPKRSSQELLLNGSIRSSDLSSDGLVAFVSAENKQPRYASSAATSPEKIASRQFSQHRRTLSLPFKSSGHHNDDEGACQSGDGFSEYSEDGSKGDDGSLSDVARATSWSEYFVTAGNGFAVEEAEEWMVDLSELFLGHKFASGAHSRLYLGKYRDFPVAVKILRVPDDDEEIVRRLEREFRSEIHVLSRVHHPNVVKFIGACKKPPVCCIITEFLALGSLRSYLHNQQPLPLKLVVDMALDVARGMEYLHSQGVIHRDLKSGNLVLAEDLCVKITDFGVACFEWETSMMTDDMGTYRWMAPEMISKKLFSKKADVYSFGIVLWELLTGHVPFEDLTPVQAAFAVVHKHARPPLPLDCPNVLGHLMHQCWSIDPSKRPDFSNVVAVLEEVQESIVLNRHMSIFHSRHHHTHGLFCCFFGGCAASEGF